MNFINPGQTVQIKVNGHYISINNDSKYIASYNWSNGIITVSYSHRVN